MTLNEGQGHINWYQAIQFSSGVHHCTKFERKQSVNVLMQAKRKQSVNVLMQAKRKQSVNVLMHAKRKQSVNVLMQAKRKQSVNVLMQAKRKQSVNVLMQANVKVFDEIISALFSSLSTYQTRHNEYEVLQTNKSQQHTNSTQIHYKLCEINVAEVYASSHHCNFESRSHDV